jgi:hypothetical protein
MKDNIMKKTIRLLLLACAMSTAGFGFIPPLTEDECEAAARERLRQEQRKNAEEAASLEILQPAASKIKPDASMSQEYEGHDATHSKQTEIIYLIDFLLKNKEQFLINETGKFLMYNSKKVLDINSGLLEMVVDQCCPHFLKLLLNCDVSMGTFQGKYLVGDAIGAYLGGNQIARIEDRYKTIKLLGEYGLTQSAYSKNKPSQLLRDPSYAKNYLVQDQSEEQLHEQCNELADLIEAFPIVR